MSALMQRVLTTARRRHHLRARLYGGFLLTKDAQGAGVQRSLWRHRDPGVLARPLSSAPPSRPSRMKLRPHSHAAREVDIAWGDEWDFSVVLTSAGVPRSNEKARYHGFEDAEANRVGPP